MSSFNPNLLPNTKGALPGEQADKKYRVKIRPADLLEDDYHDTITVELFARDADWAQYYALSWLDPNVKFEVIEAVEVDF